MILLPSLPQQRSVSDLWSPQSRPSLDFEPKLCKSASVVNCVNMQFEEQPTPAQDYFSIPCLVLYVKIIEFFIGHLPSQVALFSILVSIAFETVFVVLLVDVQFSERALDAKEISVSSWLPWPS